MPPSSPRPKRPTKLMRFYIESCLEMLSIPFLNTLGSFYYVQPLNLVINFILNTVIVMLKASFNLQNQQLQMKGCSSYDVYLSTNSLWSKNLVVADLFVATRPLYLLFPLPPSSSRMPQTPQHRLHRSKRLVPRPSMPPTPPPRHQHPPPLHHLTAPPTLIESWNTLSCPQSTVSLIAWNPHLLKCPTSPFQPPLSLSPPMNWTVVGEEKPPPPRHILGVPN